MKGENMEKEILDKIFEYGGIDGAHHKQWVLNEIVKIITEDKYDDWVRAYQMGDDGFKTYIWDEGVAP